MRTVESILPEIALWRGKEVTCAPLNGGLSNTTYKVLADGTPYVLRINGSQNDFLRLDRLGEVEAVRQAHALGIGAKVFLGTPEYLVTEFLPGRILTRLKVHQPAFIQKVADILRKAHTIEGVGRECNPFYLVNMYINGGRALGAETPDGLDEYLREMGNIVNRSERYAKYLWKYCHNDVYCINILEHEGELRLIDWELSGLGFIFFDFATVSSINAFSPEEDRLLLEGYFGYYEDEFDGLLRDMKVMNMLREIGWAFLHHAMQATSVNHNFDYYESMMRFLNRLKDGQVTP